MYLHTRIAVAGLAVGALLFGTLIMSAAVASL